MSAETPTSLAKASEPTQLPIRKRRSIAALAALFVFAVLGGVLYAWEPWVDRSPFTARAYQLASTALFTASGDGKCDPNDAGAKVELLGEDRRLLAESVFPAQGEVRTGGTGVASGLCFFYIEFHGVPGGEDSYYMRGGTKFFQADGTSTESLRMDQRSLSQSPEAAKKMYLNLKASAD